MCVDVWVGRVLLDKHFIFEETFIPETMKLIITLFIVLFSLGAYSQTIDEVIFLLANEVMKDTDATDRSNAEDFKTGAIPFEFPSYYDLDLAKLSVRNVFSEKSYFNYVLPWKYDEEKDWYRCSYEIGYNTDTYLEIVYFENETHKIMMFVWKPIDSIM